MKILLAIKRKHGAKTNNGADSKKTKQGEHFMAMGKRQLVLAALVLALGAAVYMNWQFTGNHNLVATNALASQKEPGTAQLVNADAKESKKAPKSNKTAKDAKTTKTSKKSAKTSAAKAKKTDAPAESAKENAADSESFSQARLNRQKSRDTAVEMLEKVLKDSGASEAAKKEAVAKAADIAKNILRENNVENLIKTKGGYKDCVAYIQNGECSVVVQGPFKGANDPLIIKDIIKGQTSIPFENIKIIEAK